MQQRSDATLWFAAHACCSIGLTLANKALAVSFPRPFFVIGVQNAGSALLTLLLAACGLVTLRVPSLLQVARACLSSAFLVGLCWTNLVGLRFMSVPMYVVGRNLVPVLTAWGETALLGADFGLTDVGPLVLVLAGSTLYAQGDESWELRGVHLALANAVLVTMSMLLEKRLITTGTQNPMEVNCSRCLCSLPQLAVLAYLYGEQADVEGDWPLLGATSLLAFGIGIASFQLQARVHATSIQIANVAYKLTTTVASLALFPVSIAYVGWVGYALSFFGFGLYVVRRGGAKDKKK